MASPKQSLLLFQICPTHQVVAIAFLSSIVPWLLKVGVTLGALPSYWYTLIRLNLLAEEFCQPHFQLRKWGGLAHKWMGPPVWTRVHSFISIVKGLIVNVACANCQLVAVECSTTSERGVCVCGGGLWHGIGQGFGCAIDAVDVVTCRHLTKPWDTEGGPPCLGGLLNGPCGIGSVALVKAPPSTAVALVR